MSGRVSRRASWREDPEQRLAADVLEGKVHAMGARIDRHGVRVRRAQGAECAHAVTGHHERRHDPRLRRYVQSLPAGVPGEDIRVVTNAKALRGAHRPQVEHDERPAPLAGDEGAASSFVDGESVGTLDAGEVVTRDDLLATGIDCDELVARLFLY